MSLNRGKVTKTGTAKMFGNIFCIGSIGSEKYIVNRYILIEERIRILGEIGNEKGTCITT